MKKKVVILGSGGMAGHMIYHVLKSTDKYVLVDVCRNQKFNDTTVLIDVTDFKVVENFLKETMPDVVINGIGMLIRQSEERPADAILLNSYFPNLLSKLGRAYNYRLIHLTTDCVFSGNTGGYTENSFRDGDTMYARTRALGEIINDKDLSIRTSLVGPELKSDGTGLLHWFIMQKGTINGFSNAFWTGVTTLELARAIDQFIEQGITGLYNFVPDYKISKYDLLNIFKRYWNREIIINDYQEFRSDKSLVCTRSDFNYKKLSYEKMIDELNTWISKRPEIYATYN